MQSNGSDQMANGTLLIIKGLVFIVHVALISIPLITEPITSFVPPPSHAPLIIQAGLKTWLLTRSVYIHMCM